MNSTMRNFRWLAVIPALLGLPFLFFGLIWVGVVQLVAAAGLFALACVIWRCTAGEWPRLSA